MIFKILVASSLITNAAFCQEISTNFPYIINGGIWDTSTDENKSNITRICKKGFTHINSYKTEGNLKSNPSIDSAIIEIKEQDKKLLALCSTMRMVVGIPRGWINNEDYNKIESYVQSIEKSEIRFDYWYSDEMIFQMVLDGKNLNRAVNIMEKVSSIIKSASKREYILVEPGGYNQQTLSILKELNNIKHIQPAFDEYIISTKGELTSNTDSVAKMLQTYSIFNPRKPITTIEIGQPRKKINFNYNDIKYLMLLTFQKSNGFIFYEERWSSDETIKITSEAINLIEKIRGKKITTKEIDPLSHIHEVDNLYIESILNKNYLSIKIQPQ